MAQRAHHETSLEDFDAWAKANARVNAVAEAAGENGGPGLSLVPIVDVDVAWPTDLLPAPVSSESSEASAGANPETPETTATAFDGVELPATPNRLAGWSADRQRLFLATLAGDRIGPPRRLCRPPVRPLGL